MELLDFYRGTLSARLLGVYVRQLSVKSALVREMNGGVPPWTRLEHLIADLWALQAKAHFGNGVGDHPVRAEMEAKARSGAKLARVIELKAVFEKRKRAYGIEGVT